MKNKLKGRESMYQKMISYIHLYDENGEKGQNIGFAKLALQNQNYKLRLQMRNVAWNEKEWSVYGYVRDKDILHTACFGTLKMRNGFGEGLFSGNTGEVFARYRIVDLGGFLLIEKGKEKKEPIKNFCVSQWDDGKIDINMVDFRHNAVEGEVLHAAELKEEQQDAEEDSEAQEVLGTFEKIDIEQEEEMQEENEETETQETMEEVEVETLQPIEESEEEELLKEESVESTATGESEPSQPTGQNLGQRLLESFFMAREARQEKKVLNQEIQPTDADSSVAVKEPETVSSPVMQIQKEVKKEPEEREEQEREDWNLEQKEQREMDIWEVFQEHKNNLERRYKQIKENQQEEKNIWMPGEELLRVFPDMNPFFGNDVVASVRMEPKDIGGFPMEYWYLANNSFLLHGYYCYRHLLFMKMRNEAEYQYAIAVPGNSDHREKFMANMFGFEYFKAVQSRGNAGFGYWWRRLV